MRSKPQAPHKRICNMSIDERTTAIMEDIDCIDKRLDALMSERNQLIVENEELASALRQRTSERDASLELLRKEQLGRERQSPDMRAIVGELRKLNVYLSNGDIAPAKGCLRFLLERLDESPNQGQQ